MEADIQIISGLYFSISAIGLLVLYKLFKDYKKDQVRDNLFSLRDQLFDYAIDNGIINHPGYRKLREIMNAVIRYADRISIIQLVLWSSIAFRAPIERRTLYERWEKTLDDLPEEDKERLIEYHNRAMMIIFRYLVESSLLCTVFIRCPSMIMKIKEHLFRPVSARLFRGWQLIEAEALEKS